MSSSQIDVSTWTKEQVASWATGFNFPHVQTLLKEDVNGAALITLTDPKNIKEWFAIPMGPCIVLASNVKQLLEPARKQMLLKTEVAYQNEVLENILLDTFIITQDLPQQQLPSNFFKNLEKNINPINAGRDKDVVLHDNVLQLAATFMETLATDLNAPGQVLQRAYEFFSKFPEASDYRGFFTDAVHWFFCLIRRGGANEDDIFYITELLQFDLTTYNGGEQPKNMVCELMWRHLLWAQETYNKMKASAEVSELYKPPPGNVDMKDREIVVVDAGMEYRFSIVRVLGTGRSSVVYECHSDLFESNVCVKCEPFDDSIQLLNESYILRILQGISGVPCVLVFGSTADSFVLVTNIVGVPLAPQKWTPSQLQSLWISAFHTIECIHRRGVVITDMKPEHLILSSSGLYLVDYGCAYQIQYGRRVKLLFFDPVFSSRMEFTKFGNPGFASDFESLAFCFYYLKNNTLPWLDIMHKHNNNIELQNRKSDLVAKMGTISAAGECVLSQ